MAKLTLAAVRTLIIEQTKTLMDELKGLQGEMNRRMSAVEKKIERIDNSLLACQAGLSQPLTQETLSFADAVGHPQNSHPLQQTPTSTRSTTTSKKRLPPSTSQHVDPAKTLVVAKPADPIRLQNTMNLQTSLNERDRSIVPLIATAKVVSNGNLFVEAKTTEGLDELRNKIAPLTSDLFGEAASLRVMDDSKTRPKHVIIRNVPAHYDADTILEEARVEYSSASSHAAWRLHSTARTRKTHQSLVTARQKFTLACANHIRRTDEATVKRMTESSSAKQWHKYCKQLYRGSAVRGHSHNDDVSDQALLIPGYSFLRRDRRTHGGGVALYYRSSLRLRRLTSLETQDHEVIWFQASTRDHDIIGCAAYWPHGSDLDITQHLQHALDEVSIEFNTIVLLAGDLNAHHPDLSKSISTNTAGRLLQRFATVNALTQVIQAPTRVTDHSSSCLDILLTNIPEEINFLGVYPGIGTSDHSVACVDLKTTSVFTHTEDSAIIRPRLHFNTHSTNWKTVNDPFSNINWHYRFAACNVEKTWTLFKDAYEEVLGRLSKKSRLPSRRTNHERHQHNTLNQELIRLRATQHAAWRLHTCANHIRRTDEATVKRMTESSSAKQWHKYCKQLYRGSAVRGHSHNDDDTMLYRTGKDPDLICPAIEEDLRIAAKWADIWGMRFNASKTVAMYISRTTATPPPITFAGATLEYSHEHRHLGFILDSALSFHAHVNALTRKGATEVFLLRRLSYKVKDRDLLLKIYKI
ncbi:hypothetical protein CAPTEDRAFT_207934 [Capitella teleta]|uniref:Endonuclease/exonuclease/phosphatase domain-containing protein n=1 Tax=Capitella teleta TaxID=283909 RepID=R7VLH1_CAPTE|nr:hypothetical protein CAPTEDRAFT_207934 [Capitella teleta]|eukprot:ELU17620.1 hypothetical protein CAPTEDRAFT_207934 [Capitella teleta]